jgi:hypothetical protein
MDALVFREIGGHSSLKIANIAVQGLPVLIYRHNKTLEIQIQVAISKFNNDKAYNDE